MTNSTQNIAANRNLGEDATFSVPSRIIVVRRNHRLTFELLAGFADGDVYRLVSVTPVDTRSVHAIEREGC